MSKSVQAALQRQQAAAQRPNTSISGASNFNRASAGVAPAQQRAMTGRLAGQGQQVQQQAAQQQYRQKMAAINAARQAAPTASLARGQPVPQPKFQQQQQQQRISGRQPQSQQQPLPTHTHYQPNYSDDNSMAEQGGVSQIPIDKAIALICLRLGKLEQGEIKRHKRELEGGIGVAGIAGGLEEGVATIDAETIEQIMGRLDKLDSSAAKMTDMQNRAEAARQLSLKTMNSIGELSKEVNQLKADMDEIGKILRSNDERLLAIEQSIMQQFCGDMDMNISVEGGELGAMPEEQYQKTFAEEEYDHTISTLDDNDTNTISEIHLTEGGTILETNGLNSELHGSIDLAGVVSTAAEITSIPPALIPSRDPRDLPQPQHDDGLYRPTFSKVGNGGVRQ